MSTLLRKLIRKIVLEQLEEVTLKVPKEQAQKDELMTLMSLLSKKMPGSEESLESAKEEIAKGNWDEALKLIKMYFIMKKISTFVLSICILMFSSSCQKESSTTKLDDSMSKVRDIVGGSGNLIALNEKDINDIPLLSIDEFRMAYKEFNSPKKYGIVFIYWCSIKRKS